MPLKTRPSTKVAKRAATPKAKPETKAAPTVVTARRVVKGKTAPTTADVAEGTGTTTGRTLNEYGFVENTDSALIAEALIAGGVDRNDVNRLAEESIGAVNGTANRNGGEKYVPSMVSAILNKMLATGRYEVVSTWKLVKKEETQEEAPKTKRKISK